jgi:hypothetical protein
MQVTAIPRATPPEHTGSARPPVVQGNAPPKLATARAAHAQPSGGREPGIVDLTDDAGERASSAPPPTNVPTMKGTFSMEWAPTKERVTHDSPPLVRDMASTMRKVGQTHCQRLAPHRLIHNRAVPKANGNKSVASGWLKMATRVRETGAAKIEDVFGGGTLACAALLPEEAKGARGFPRLRDPVIIPPKELERQDAELCDTDKEGAHEEAMKAAQPVKGERFSAEKDMECSPKTTRRLLAQAWELSPYSLPKREEAPPRGLTLCGALPRSTQAQTSPRQNHAGPALLRPTVTIVLG